MRNLAKPVFSPKTKGTKSQKLASVAKMDSLSPKRKKKRARKASKKAKIEVINYKTLSILIDKEKEKN